MPFKIHRSFLIPVLLLSVLLSACSYKSRNILFKDNREISNDSIKTVYVVQQGSGDHPGPHKIAPGDRLEVRNLQNEQMLAGESAAVLSNPLTFQVGIDGLVTLPALGNVNLTGLTREEASERLQKLYSEKILKGPIIEVNITNLQATILGEVRVPNRFILDHEGTTLTELLGIAGGPTVRANLNRVKIIRGDPKNPQILFLNLKNSQTITDPRLIIQDHDIVYIEPNKINGAGDQASGFSTIAQPVLILVNTILVVFALVRR